MKTFIYILKIILWAVLLPFAFGLLAIRYLLVKSKAKKYQKQPDDFMDSERYRDIFKLISTAKFIFKMNLKGKLVVDKKLLNKAQLIVINHRSLIDTLVIYSLCYQQLHEKFHFVAKKEVLDSKLGILYKYIDTLILDRQNLRQGIQLLDEQKELLKKGHTIIVFPEGTRRSEPCFNDFHSGAFEPAYKALCPIQPLVLTNTELYKETKTKFKDLKPIKLQFLDPIQASKFITIDRMVFTKNLQKEMQKTYDKLADTAPNENKH